MRFRALEFADEQQQKAFFNKASSGYSRDIEPEYSPQIERVTDIELKNYSKFADTSSQSNNRISYAKILITMAEILFPGMTEENDSERY